MDCLRVQLAAGGHVDYTAHGDGLTGFQVHPSGCLQVWAGVDRPPRWTLSFGTWTMCEVDPD